MVPIAAGQSQESLQTINSLLHAGECVCLFPEGAISRNGQLGKFHTGYERTLEGVTDGVIVPFYLHGLWGSSLSRADEGLRQARAPDLKRDLIVAFGPALPLDTTAKQLKQKVFELSITAWQTYAEQLPPIPLAWLRAAKRKPSRLCVADDSRTSASNRQLASSVVELGKQLRLPGSAKNIGILLPPGAQATRAVMAVLLQGKVVVPLNHTLPGQAFASLLQAADVDRIITSRSFLATLAEQGNNIDPELQGQNVLYIDDLATRMAPWRKALGALQFACLPASLFYRLHGHRVAATSPAAILLTDPGEHAPRAVQLSHRNIMANCKQVSDVLNTQIDDVILSCIPAYHPFGLTVTTIMPLVEGIPMACHSQPADSLGIAKTVARFNATILPGSPGTLDLYARNDDIHPLMLNSLRLVVSGSEQLPESVRNAFELKFGKRIYEGFSLAEATAVASVNIPDAMDTTDWKVQQGAMAGTLGMPLPGTGLKIIDAISGVEQPLGQEGQVLICGSQIMQGYLNDPEKTGSAIIDIDGQRWLKTGNTGHLTEEGFLILSV